MSNTTHPPITTPRADRRTGDDPIADDDRLRLAAARYASLRTFRRNGSAVDVPIWVAVEGDRLWFRSKEATAKIRRIAADPRVEFRLCDYRGRVRSDVVATGRARVLDRTSAAAAHAEAVLHAKYGWQWGVIPLITLPGISKSDVDVPLRQRVHHMRNPAAWPWSCLVEVTLDDRLVGGR